MNRPPPSWTAAQVLSHVEHAVSLELFTIPPYLSAYYSIVQGGSAAADKAAESILTVLGEEMMHLERALSLANALGRGPRITGRAAPSYPGILPSDRDRLRVTLGPATDAQIRCFMSIELPTERDPYNRPDLPPQDEYGTIGEFYHSLTFGLGQVYGPGGLPWPTSNRPQIYGNFDDDRFPITDLGSALKALGLVVLQGEGASLRDPEDDHHEPAHYYKFEAMLGTLGSGDLRPMIPSTAGLSYSTRCARLLDFFDACYSHVLRLLEAAFNGQGKIGPAVGLMSAALTPLAYRVVDTPYQAGDAGPETEHTLTPRFRYTTTPLQQAYAALDPADREAENVQEAASALELAPCA